MGLLCQCLSCNQQVQQAASPLRATPPESCAKNQANQSCLKDAKEVVLRHAQVCTQGKQRPCGWSISHPGCREVEQVRGPATAATGILSTQAGSLMQAGCIAANDSLTKQHNMPWTEATVMLAAPAKAKGCSHSSQVLLNFQRQARY